MSLRNEARVPEKKTMRGRTFIAAILVLLIIVGLLVALKRNQKQPEEYFVQYENATMLVVVEYGEKDFFCGYSKAVGFMDGNIYENIKNGKQKGKIEIYHPYIKGKRILIDSESITAIEIKTYESFYEEYPPTDYI